MTRLYASVGSVTSATRLAKKLNKAGNFSANVIHTPSEINNGGCSYSVKTTNADRNTIQQVANDYGIVIRKYYIENSIGGEVKYHVIS